MSLSAKGFHRGERRGRGGLMEVLFRFVLFFNFIPCGAKARERA